MFMGHNSANTIPLGTTIGLGLFALCLSLAGYGLRLLTGEPLDSVLSHALRVVSFFMLGVPSLVCLMAMIMNRFFNHRINLKNAWTLGWLLSAVAMLSLMGVYS